MERGDRALAKARTGKSKEGAGIGSSMARTTYEHLVARITHRAYQRDPDVHLDRTGLTACKNSVLGNCFYSLHLFPASFLGTDEILVDRKYLNCDHRHGSKFFKVYLRKYREAFLTLNEHRAMARGLCLLSLCSLHSHIAQNLRGYGAKTPPPIAHEVDYILNSLLIEPLRLIHNEHWAERL
jgi:hypothetical protein